MRLAFLVLLAALPLSAQTYPTQAGPGLQADPVTALQASTKHYADQCATNAAEANVLCFGADPTGTTDSTAAFNAAITQLATACKGGTLYIPAGTYKHTGITVTVPNTCTIPNPTQVANLLPISIRGSGRNNTHLINTSTVNSSLCFVAGPGDNKNPAYYFNISDIDISAQTLGTAPIIDETAPAAPSVSTVVAGALTGQGNPEVKIAYSYANRPNAPSCVQSSIQYTDDEGKLSQGVHITIPDNSELVVAAPSSTVGANSIALVTAATAYNVYVNGVKANTTPIPIAQPFTQTAVAAGRGPLNNAFQPVQSAIQIAFGSNFTIRNVWMRNHEIGLNKTLAWRYSIENSVAECNIIGALFNSSGGTAEGATPNYIHNFGIDGNYWIGAYFAADPDVPWTGGDAGGGGTNCNVVSPNPRYAALSAGITGASFWFRSSNSSDARLTDIDFEGGFGTDVVVGDPAGGEYPTGITIANSHFNNDNIDPAIASTRPTAVRIYNGSVVLDSNSFGSYYPTSTDAVIKMDNGRLTIIHPQFQVNGTNLITGQGRQITSVTDPNLYQYSAVYMSYGGLTKITPSGISTDVFSTTGSVQAPGYQMPNATAGTFYTGIASDSSGNTILTPGAGGYTIAKDASGNQLGVFAAHGFGLPFTAKGAMDVDQTGYNPGSAYQAHGTYPTMTFIDTGHSNIQGNLAFYNGSWLMDQGLTLSGPLTGAAGSFTTLGSNVYVTGSIGGSALAAGACASAAVTVVAPTTASLASTSPQVYPGDGFVWQAYISATNTATVKVCAIVAGTPAASPYNVRVTQ